jgi:hypothetical protein
VASLAKNLGLASDLCETLPPYLASVEVPKLSLALGAAAVYIDNPELAIGCYWEGLRCCHSQDLHTIAPLRLEAGKQMTLLAERDPEHWRHVVAPGRSLLHAAADNFTRLNQLSSAVLRRVQANLYLLMSYVAEARARKMVIDSEVVEHGHVGRRS